LHSFEENAVVVGVVVLKYSVIASIASYNNKGYSSGKIISLGN
jgi:hypothetical protein